MASGSVQLSPVEQRTVRANAVTAHSMAAASLGIGTTDAAVGGCSIPGAVEALVLLKLKVSTC